MILRFSCFTIFPYMHIVTVQCMTVSNELATVNSTAVIYFP